MHPTAVQHMFQLKDDQQDKRREILAVLLVCMDLGGVLCCISSCSVFDVYDTFGHSERS